MSFRYLNVWNFRNLLCTRCALVLHCCYTEVEKKQTDRGYFVTGGTLPVKEVKICLDLLLWLAFFKQTGISVFNVLPSPQKSDIYIDILVFYCHDGPIAKHTDMDRRWLRDGVSIIFMFFYQLRLIRMHKRQGSFVCRYRLLDGVTDDGLVRSRRRSLVKVLFVTFK